MKVNVHIEIDTDRLTPSQLAQLRKDVCVVLTSLDEAFLARIDEVVDAADKLEFGVRSAARN